MRSILPAFLMHMVLAENIADESVLLQFAKESELVHRANIGRCWHWVTDKFYDGLALEDLPGDENFVGKMLNPSLGEQRYESGGRFSMDTAALTMAGIIALASGAREPLASDKSIEGWRVHDGAPCRGSIRGRNVSASCCSGVSFALASFPRLNHVGIIMEKKNLGDDDGLSLYVLDPTVNQFSEDRNDRRKVRVLMEELSHASKIVTELSGGQRSKAEKMAGLADYGDFRQYFIPLDTFFTNNGDLRYGLAHEDEPYRTFRSDPDPTVCFGHGPLLQKAKRRWFNVTQLGLGE